MMRRAKCWTARPAGPLMRCRCGFPRAGEVEIIDMEFKAGTKSQVRIV
jgi:hypothetical protein